MNVGREHMIVLKSASILKDHIVVSVELDSSFSPMKNLVPAKLDMSFNLTNERVKVLSPLMTMSMQSYMYRVIKGVP